MGRGGGWVGRLTVEEYSEEFIEEFTVKTQKMTLCRKTRQQYHVFVQSYDSFDVLCSNHTSHQDMYSKIETNDEGDISMRNVITHIQTKGKEKWTLSFLLHKARKRKLFRLVSRNICFKFFL